MDPAAVVNTVASEPVKLILTRRVPGLIHRQLHVTNGKGSLVFRTANLCPVVNFRLSTALADASGSHLMRFRRKVALPLHPFAGLSLIAYASG